MEIENSIYNMALYTLVDYKSMDEWQDNFKEEKGFGGYFVSNVKLTEKEGDGIFFGNCIVVTIQFLTAVLVTKEFVLNDDMESASGIKQLPVTNFWILIPRTISSFYMHSTLAAEISNALNMMKYVTNHPDLFKRKDLEDDDDEKTDETDGWYIRIFYAFMLGFVQYFLTVYLEIMTIVYLNSLGSYLFILICYAALSGVTTFDNMYAATLASNHPI